jgi:hypothetical protein
MRKIHSYFSYVCDKSMYYHSIYLFFMKIIYGDRCTLFIVEYVRINIRIYANLVDINFCRQLLTIKYAIEHIARQDAS